MTYRFEYLLLRYCQIMTQKAAAELLGITASTLSDLLHRTITRLREGSAISKPPALTRPPTPNATSMPPSFTTWTAVASPGPAPATAGKPFPHRKGLNGALDEVRKEQWRVAAKHERKALKGIRWILYRHSSTCPHKDNRDLRDLEKATVRSIAPGA